MDLFPILIGGAVLIVFIIQLFLFWLYIRLPQLELNEEIEDIYKELDKFGNDLEVYIADIYDKVEQVLKPINKRLASRATREEEKGLNRGETIEKKGLISLQQAREYGLIK